MLLRMYCRKRVFYLSFRDNYKNFVKRLRLVLEMTLWSVGSMPVSSKTID